MPIMTPAELISALPGAQEDIASGALSENELIESARALHAQVSDGVRMPAEPRLNLG